MFTKTLSISTKRVNTALCKMRSDKVTDNRGIHRKGKRCIPLDVIENVKKHISNFPRYKSHYCLVLLVSFSVNTYTRHIFGIFVNYPVFVTLLVFIYITAWFSLEYNYFLVFNVTYIFHSVSMLCLFHVILN